MLRRSSRRLAGSLAIELLLACAAVAAGTDYQAGTASIGQSSALALADRQGRKAIILNVGFAAPLSVADQIAALAGKAYGIERSALLIRAGSEAEPMPQEALTAIGGALSRMAPAKLRYSGGKLTVTSGAGCTAVLADAVIAGCDGDEGEAVRGPIRSALRIVDLDRGLQTREATPRYATVQAIAIGLLTLLAGPSNYVQPAAGRIVATSPPVERDGRIATALRDVLARIGR